MTFKTFQCEYKNVNFLVLNRFCLKSVTLFWDSITGTIIKCVKNEALVVRNNFNFLNRWEHYLSSLMLIMSPDLSGTVCEVSRKRCYWIPSSNFPFYCQCQPELCVRSVRFHGTMLRFKFKMQGSILTLLDKIIFS